MPRRLLPLFAAALLGLAGCTTVSSAPDTARSRPSLAPGAAVRPSVLQEPLRAPSGTSALVRTGRARPGEHRAATAPGRTGPVRGPVAAPRPRAAAPAAPPVRHPRPGRRTPVRRHAPRPRPAPRLPADARMRDLCRQADGVADARIVRLCHDTFG
ncbi:hypothetical protein [Streptomyces sp. NRRL S-1022]|uniref:hypothetical protein n=1 Tax=Streptomyces sp. NRRL S-1022 TaxID=1463880 RepID=UPI000B2083C1|nr:hypothetical protein [Streptomyces sp. NRRL S-1022]